MVLNYYVLDREPPAKTYFVRLLSSPANMGILEGGGGYYANTEATIKAIAPEDGSLDFKQWISSKSGEVITSEDSYTFTVTSDIEFTAVFAVMYTITVSTSIDGAGMIVGAGRYEKGEEVTLTTIPNTGYRFLGWRNEATGAVVSTEKQYTFTPSSSVTFSALYEEIPVYTVTLIADPVGSGIMIGAGRYEDGQTATIIQRNETGYRFIGWYSQETGELVSTDGSYSFVPTADITLIAKYIEIPVYTVTVVTSPDGEADGGTVSGAGRITEGDTCTLVATANEGYMFEEWFIDGVSVGTGPTYSFVVEHDTTVQVKFVKAYTVTILIDPEDSENTVTGAGTYKAGSSVTISATNAQGFKFTSYTIDDVVVSTDENYTFTIESNVTITAVFGEGLSFDTYIEQEIISDSNIYNTVKGICYGDNEYVAVALEVNSSSVRVPVVYRSKQIGGPWEKFYTVNQWVGSSELRIAYGNGYYVIMGNYNYNVGVAYSTSVDGEWTYKIVANTIWNSSQYFDIKFLNGKFIITGGSTNVNSNFIAYSRIYVASTPDETWENISLGGGGYGGRNDVIAQGATFDGTNYVVKYVTSSGTSNAGAMYTAKVSYGENLNKMTIKSVGGSYNRYGIAFVNEYYIIYSMVGNTIRYTKEIDKINSPTQKTVNGLNYMFKVVEGVDNFVATGRSYNSTTKEYRATIAVADTPEVDFNVIKYLNGNTSSTQNSISDALYVDGVFFCYYVDYNPTTKLYKSRIVFINPDWLKQ